MTRRRIVSADEQDAYTSWRHVLAGLQKAGRVKRIKQRTHRRERREGRADIERQREQER